MRVAVLADIHGNPPALKAVLAEIDRLPVDRIALDGDIAAGPLPAETLDRLAELGERAIWVHGNGERAAWSPASTTPPTRPSTSTTWRLGECSPATSATGWPACP